MLLPAFHGAIHGQFLEARNFLYSSLLGLFIIYMVALAQSNQSADGSGFKLLVMLILGYVSVPAFLALPFFYSIGNTRFVTAYLDMVSAFTTTGFTVFPGYRLSETLHLWRAVIAWYGGAVVWVSALAILAPVGLSDYARADKTIPVAWGNGSARERQALLQRQIFELLPIYIGLTGLLWILMSVSGVASYEGFIMSLSVMSTSGIMGNFSRTAETSFWTVEAIVLIFLLLAVYRNNSPEKRLRHKVTALASSEEVRLAFFLIGLFVLILLPFQMLTRGGDADGLSLLSVLKAVWANIFTLISFLTTHGWISVLSDEARTWSGFSIPSIVLLGLALIGGGAATTAGGIKLIRIYALYSNALEETGRLLHPSSVGVSAGSTASLKRETAFKAWIYFMLFIIAMSLVALALTMSGLDFEAALVGAVSAMSTTGPLLDVFQAFEVSFTSLSVFGSLVFCIAMILGRLEVLILLSLFNPLVWRK